MTQPLHRMGRLAAFVLIATLSLTACGGSDDTADSGGGSTDNGAAGSVDTAALLDTAYTGQFGEPPTTATTPPEDVNLWVLSCGEQIPTCADPAASAKEAGEAVGWDVTVCDGMLNPEGWGTCVRQAISAGADALLPIGIDCASLQQPFQEAKDAGMTVVGAGGADCDATGGEALWASERLQLDGLSVEDYWNLQGKLAADWLIGTSEGSAQVLQLNFTDAIWGPWLSDGFAEEMATCSGCEVVATLDIANADVGSGQLATKFSTALLQNPTADGMFVPVGGWMTAGLSQAVQSSGRSADLDVISEFGTAATYDLIRTDAGLDAAIGYPSAWGSYGSVDTVIRVLNGEEPLVQGDGVQVVDADHNLPDEGDDFESDTDFRSAYESAWGI